MTVRLSIAFAILAASASAQSGIPAITTGQYNTSRTAANLNEILLNPSNVNVNQFGKLFSWPVDGWIFAQPLYVPGVQIGGASTNVVYVATMHNSVYAFNADSSSATPLWHVNLGTSVKAPTFNGCPVATGTGSELGILSTPVIDPSSNTMYVVAATPSSNYYVHYLHALDITTGHEKSGSPVQIQASVLGNGYDNQNGTVNLTPSTDVQRTALLLANGSVYAGFGNCGQDGDPWHGWVIGYSTANLNNPTTVFNSTPNGGQGGIWQSGRGLVADASGSIYFTTGNATAYTANDGGVTTGNSTSDAKAGDYPMRFVQLLSTGQFGGSYPPANYAALNSHDLDFSSSGPLLVPGTNLIVAGGKDGVIYVFNPSNLATPQQSFQATGTSTCAYSSDGCDQIHDLAFWNNTLYVWGSHDILRAYTFNPSTNQFTTSPVSQNNTYQVGYYAPSMAVSANSTQQGVLWAVTANSVVHAFNASNVSSELWNSTQNANRDALPSFPKFVEPTVANGRVYVASHSNQVAVYGLLSDFSLSSSVQSQTVTQGSSSSFTVTVTSLSNSSSSATFSVSGLPSGATATFSPSSVTGSGSSTVTINAASSTSTGTYNLIVSATRGGVTRTTSVSLTVTVPADTTPPQWSCCTYSTSGSSYVLTFSAWDTQSGLKSIQAVQVVNATVSIPQFTVGTTSVVNFSVTESGTSSYAKFQLTDVAGNVSYVDPAFLDPKREAGTPVPFTVKYITADEGIVTIQNGSPGLKNVRLEIDNGLNVGKVQVAGLKDGEVRVVNIVSLLPALPSAATVTITPLGKPGGTASFMFASTPMTGSPQ